MRGAVWVSTGLAAALAAGACGTKEAVNEDGDAGASDGGDSNAGSSGVRGGNAGTSAGGSNAGEDGSGGTSGTSTTGGDGGTSNMGGSNGDGGDPSGGATNSGATNGGSNGGGGDPSGGGTGGSGGDTSGGSTSGGNGGASSGGTDSGTGGTAGSGGGTNLITNGDFSNGDTNWNHDGASASHTVTDGVWCGQFLIHSVRIIAGWPDDSSQALSLSGEYTFSFKMSLSGSATILAKIGRAVSPYTTDFQIMVTPGETLTTFTYTVPINDPQAGVAFDITGNSPPTTVCIDDVVLSPR